MYTLIGKAPARSARPGMEVTLYTHTHRSECERAAAFFSLHYDDLEIITPKGVAK
tara:strand:+ start:249 stop:413 length:165 start_codon:yes stop_codon:yes gene_type:complete